MSESRQEKILYQLKRRGPMSARDIGQQMGITTMGARQHLALLEQDQLVKTLPEEPQGRGRPVKRWALTEQGHRRFPDAHAQVTSDLLIAVTDVLGSDALDQLITQRTNATRQQYETSLGQVSGFEAKLEKLAELRSQEGYMAEIQTDDSGYWLIEHHCPICVAAETCQGFCRSELEVFESLLKGLATIKRDEHLLNGGRRCSYRITPL